MSLQDLVDSVLTILLNPLRNPMDRYQLAREFEEVLLKHRIQKTTDVDALQKIAFALVESNFQSNFQLLDQNKRLMGFEPWDGNKKSLPDGG